MHFILMISTGQVLVTIPNSCSRAALSLGKTEMTVMVNAEVKWNRQLQVSPASFKKKKFTDLVVRLAELLKRKVYSQDVVCEFVSAMPLENVLTSPSRACHAGGP
jgi:hypothetical protein